MQPLANAHFRSRRVKLSKSASGWLECPSSCTRDRAHASGHRARPSRRFQPSPGPRVRSGSLRAESLLSARHARPRSPAVRAVAIRQPRRLKLAIWNPTGGSVPFAQGGTCPSLVALSSPPQAPYTPSQPLLSISNDALVSNENAPAYIAAPEQLLWSRARVLCTATPSANVVNSSNIDTRRSPLDP